MIVPDRRLSWFRLLFEIRGSALMRIRGRLAAVFIVACVITYLAEEARALTDLTPLPFTLIGLALSVFLGFRNNTSYDRFWEGRKLWGGLVNHSRNFARLVRDVIDPRATQHPQLNAQEVSALRHDLVYRVIAFAHALRMHLRGELSDLDSLLQFLPKHEVEALKAQRNVPLSIANAIGERLAHARFHGVLHGRDVYLLERLLSDMVEVQGGCERILNTPIPWSYTVLIHSIVATYCFALPFGIVNTTHELTPIVVLMISYAFLGLDAVGDEIEDPFGTDYNDLPIATITRIIEVNLRQMLGESELPPLLTPDENRVLS